MKIKIILLTILSILLLSGCSSTTPNDVPDFIIETIDNLTGGNIFTQRDLNVDINLDDAIYKTLNNNDYEITTEGIYVLDGNMTNAQIIINTDSSSKVQLILNNVNITNTTSAIYVQKADKVFITSLEDTINNLTSTNFDDSDLSGVIYSKDDITFNGYGTLNIISAKHGIVGNDDVVLAHSTFNITSEKRGIDANDSIRINSGTFNINSQTDALRTDNDDLSKGFIYIEDGEFNITSQQDVIDCSSLLEIVGGDFDLYSGGGFDGVLNSITVGEGSGGTIQPTDLLETSMKCLKSEGMSISGGNIVMSAYEDAIHSNLNLLISGGYLEITSGDDAVHADDQMLITGGEINILNCYEGIEADFITITDGEISVVGLDDGINVSSSSGVLTISGGNIYVNTKGDCIDSNGDFIMTGGYVILESDAIYTMGDYELDIDGYYSKTGGTLVDENGNDITVNSGSTSSRPGRW